MARVIDYAWGRPSIASLQQAGAVAVSRYLSWLPNDKCLTRAEADQLRAAGIDVVSNWEYYGDWLHDYSGGYATGVQHAAEANRQHIACGAPPRRPIYFSTDFNPTDAQLPVIADYYRGVASVLGIERTGAYGGYRTIRYLFDAGVIRWGWQAYAWSNGLWDTRAQVRQVRNGVLTGGVDSDLNDTMAADFGQWGYQGVDVTPEQDQTLTDIANRVRWIDGRVASIADMTPAYADPAGKPHPAVAVAAIGKAAAGGGGPLPFDQAVAALTAALSDPAVAGAIGAAVASHIRVV